MDLQISSIFDVFVSGSGLPALDELVERVNHNLEMFGTDLHIAIGEHAKETKVASVVIGSELSAVNREIYKSAIVEEFSQHYKGVRVEWHEETTS